MFLTRVGMDQYIDDGQAQAEVTVLIDNVIVWGPELVSLVNGADIEVAATEAVRAEVHFRGVSGSGRPAVGYVYAKG